MKTDQNLYLSSTAVRWNADRDTRYAHHDPEFAKVLHVFDAEWHGIRSACGCLPGHKLTISHKVSLSDLELRYIIGLIDGHKVEHVLFQGYSHTAAELARVLRKEYGTAIDIRTVTHVTASQFEHVFELHMLRLMKEQISSGVLDGTGSVKPDFDYVFDPCWPKTLINLYPKADPYFFERDTAPSGEAFVPLENTFRKNLYVNIFAAHGQKEIRRVFSVNEPSFAEDLRTLPKLKLIPFQDRKGIFEVSARSDIVMNVTFAECQPMVQLEALAVGTPCLTGPLQIEELEDLEYTEYCTVSVPDNARAVGTAVQRIMRLTAEKPDRVKNMIDEYRERVKSTALQSYRDFLGA